MNATQEESAVRAVSPVSRRAGLRLRLSLGGGLALAVVTVSSVFAIGMLIAQKSTRDTATLLAGAEDRYRPTLRLSQALFDSITAFDRQVIEFPRTASPASFDEASAAGTVMLNIFDRIPPPTPSSPATLPPDLGDRLHALNDRGNDILALYRRRQAAAGEARNAVDSLAQRSARAGSGVASGDQLLARTSLAEVSRAATTLRESAIQLFAAPSPAANDTFARDVAMFRALMAAHAPEFERSPGRAWLELQHDDFTAALAGWRRFQEIERLVATDRAAFESSAQYLASTIEATLQGSVWSTLSDAMVRARLTAERAESHLAQVALGVLSVVLLIAIALGFGVIGPARRLLEGTRSLGRGALNVRVARGGVRELDELAGAFNDMAQALHSTQQALREQHEALERRVAERTAQLRHLANHDALTALPNRRELESHLTAAINRARTGTTGCAVLYLDIDNFKTMNDSLGHHFGDCVLREIADRLRVMTSDRSFLARLGGDEFTFVVEGIDSGLAAEAVAADVIRAFQTPIRAGNRDLLITVSIGISLCPEHGVATESLLQAADTALFYAKERGRNGYALYRSELLAAASHRFHTEQGLRRALDAGDLLLYLQPEISLKDLKATAVEALLRWRKPDGRIAAASEFIGIAEQSGLILEVSEWVLRSAIDVARQLRSGPWPMARIAVNVSPQQFLTGRFVDKVRNALHDARMPPDCLEIELTETAVQTGRGAIEAAHELRRLGVAVALDDFGAGYSSLKSLEELPLSRVKLDKSLTRSIDSSPSAAAIAVSVIGLCQELGLTVTAEGIQRTAQLDVLSPWGPLDVQGYLIARPTPIHDIARVIAESPGRLAAVWHRPARGPVHASELPAVVTSFRPRAR